MSEAKEIQEYLERNDEALIDLIISGEDREEPRLNAEVFCPLCQGNTIQVIETSEGDSERTFFQMRCLDCGCEFVLFEDLIAACRRGIENAKREIKYNEGKIEYFNKKSGLTAEGESVSDTRLTPSNKNNGGIDD